MSYDARCLELARHFMPDASEDAREALAQVVQDAVEDHLARVEAAEGGDRGRR